MSAPRVVPVEGRIDGGQLRAVVELLLGQALRAGVDPSTGVRGHPLRQLAFSMSVIGLTFAPNAWRCRDLDGYLALVFAAVLVMVLLAIVPETQEVRERHVEILGARPIARRTLFAARGAMLVVLATLVSTTFAFLPLVAAWIRFEGAGPWLPAAYACLVSGAFVAAVAGLVVVTLGLRFWPPERVRRVSQTGLVLFLVTLSIGSLLASPALVFARGAAATFSVSPGLELLPSTWFVRLAIGGGPHPVPSAAAALGLLAVSLVLGLGHGLDRLLPSLAETVPAPAVPTSEPLAVRLLRALRRVPVLGRRGLPPGAFAIAEVILVCARREEMSRTRELGSRVMALVLFVLSFSVVPALMASSLFLYLAIVAAIEGARAARQSTTPAASWLFQATPLRAFEVVRGLEASVAVRSAALPLLLLLVVTFRQHPPVLALLLVVGYAACTRIALALAIAADPVPPLSREAAVSSFTGVAAAFALGTAFVLGYQVLALLATHFGVLGLALVAFADAVTLAGAWLSGLLAAWRLERAGLAP